MANNPGPPTFPMPYGSAVPPRQQYSHRARPEDVIYPGQRNRQNQFNTMLQGPVHVNSPLPSEQFGPQGADPRTSLLPSQARAAPSVPAYQQQGFAPLNQPQARPQADAPAHLQGWPAGNAQAAVNNGVQNVPNQPVGVSDSAAQRGSMNGAGFNGVVGLTGSTSPHTMLPPGATLLLRSSSIPTPNTTNGHAQSPPNVSTTPAILSRSTSDVTPGSQPQLSVGDNAPFQIPLSGPSVGHAQAGTDTGSGTGFMRTETQQATHVPRSPFVNPTNQQLPPRGPAHPNVSTNDPRTTQSPARSATATPSASAHPPPLVDSRDSLQVQIQGYQLPSQPPHQQGMQLHPPPGSMPSLMQQPPESVIRQQRMLLQRGQPSAQLARQNFPIPTAFPNSATGLPNQFSQARPPPQVQPAAASAATHHLTPAQQHGLFPYQANPDNHGPGARGVSQPLQSRPSSTAGGSSQQAPSQPVEAAGHTPSREGYSQRSPAGLQSSQPPSEASSQASQSSTRPLAVVSSAPRAPRPPSSHPGERQRTASPSLRNGRPSLLTIPPLTNGFGTLRVMEFCTGIANKKPESDVSCWKSFVQAFIHPSGFFEITLWRVSSGRKFHLKSAILGRFFHRTFSCGVQALNITFHSPVETPVAGGGIRVRVEAAWMFSYSSGYAVTLRGPLDVIIHPGTLAPESGGAPPPVVWRFTMIQFVATEVDKKISCDAIEGKRSKGEPGLGYENIKKSPSVHLADANGGSPLMALKQTTEKPSTMLSAEPWIQIEKAKLPPDPVNEFGIPHLLLVCLDLSDSIGELTDLFKYSNDHGVGPIGSLNKVADEVRAQRPDLADAVKSHPLTIGARLQFLEQKPPATTTPPTITHTTNILNAGSNMRSSPMQVDRPAPAQIPSPHQNSSSSPKTLVSSDSASDSSNLSSPPTAAIKRKSTIEESLSASDPPPSSGRRRNNTSDSISTLSTRSTRLQHRRQSSPRQVGISTRPRRRGGTS